jgi:hypothetical protein
MMQTIVDQDTLVAIIGCLAILWLTIEFIDWVG